jgi:hypothetical protein
MIASFTQQIAPVPNYANQYTTIGALLLSKSAQQTRWRR